MLFDRRRSANYPFRSEVQKFRTYCGRSLFSPQLGWFEYVMPGYGRSELMSGVNICQVMPWSEERLVASASRDDPCFPGHLLHGQFILHPLQVWYCADFKVYFLYCCCSITVVLHTTLFFSRDLCSRAFRHAVLYICVS